MLKESGHLCLPPIAMTLREELKKIVMNSVPQFNVIIDVGMISQKIPLPLLGGKQGGLGEILPPCWARFLG
jgi:hypothetical protein